MREPGLGVLGDPLLETGAQRIDLRTLRRAITSEHETHEPAQPVRVALGVAVIIPGEEVDLRAKPIELGNASIKRSAAS